MAVLQVSRRRSAQGKLSRRRLSNMSPAALLLLRGAGGSDVATGSSTTVDWSTFDNDNKERITQEVKGSNEAVLIASKSNDGVATLKRSLNDPQINSNNATTATLVTPTAPPSPMPTHSSLKYIGNDWDPASSFPLGACEADCDTDDDCRGNLICFQRSSNSYEQVPGCLGGDENGSGADYCIRPDAGILTAPPTSVSPTISPVPTATSPQIKYVGNDWDPASSFPLDNCSGDCDYDEDCIGDLICFQRDKYEHVPGCLGGDTESERTDFCVRPDAKVVTAPPTSVSPTISPVPTATPRIQYVGNDWEPYNSFPLDNCSGDCDDDEDCKGDLICFQRDDYEHVPGCLGGDTENPRTDFCISPDATIITPPPTTAEPTISPKPTPQPTPIPTQSPRGLLDYVFTERLQNLEECMGDCDRNRDCVGDLICVQRERGEPLPGCEGAPESGTDFCIQPQYTYMPTPRPTRRPTAPPTRRPTPGPTAQPTFTPIPGGSEPSRIKMYWQEGYTWQDRDDEEWYCLQCRNECDVGQKVEIDDCRSRRLRQQFVRVEEDKTIRPAMAPELCFTHQNRADDIYLDTLSLEYCDGTEQQRFYIVGTPWQKNGKFEIRTSLRSHKQPTCLTNPHHPRTHENILPQRCDRARMHQTASWTVY